VFGSLCSLRAHHVHPFLVLVVVILLLVLLLALVAVVIIIVVVIAISVQMPGSCLKHYFAPGSFVPIVPLHLAEQSQSRSCSVGQ
jgi:hypothetical protein